MSTDMGEITKLAKTDIRYKGLKRYLNSTKEGHNGYDYDDFVAMLGTPGDILEHNGLPISKAAKRFGVTRQSFHKWVNIYLEENGVTRA